MPDGAGQIPARDRPFLTAPRPADRADTQAVQRQARHNLVIDAVRSDRDEIDRDESDRDEPNRRLMEK